MPEKPEKTAKVVPLKRAKCPTCGKPAIQKTKPFCSKRCADVDLGRWLNEDYRIPTNEFLGEDEQAGDPEDET